MPARWRLVPELNPTVAGGGLVDFVGPKWDAVQQSAEKKKIAVEWLEEKKTVKSPTASPHHQPSPSTTSQKCPFGSRPITHSSRHIIAARKVLGEGITSTIANMSEDRMLQVRHRSGLRTPLPKGLLGSTTMVVSAHKMDRIACSSRPAALMAF